MYTIIYSNASRVKAHLERFGLDKHLTTAVRRCDAYIGNANSNDDAVEGKIRRHPCPDDNDGG